MQNASYEQKDPLVIYKLEAYDLWKNMLDGMNSKAVATLMRGRLAVPDYEEAKAAEKRAAEAEELRQQAESLQQARRAQQAPMQNPYANYSATTSYSASQDSYPGESAQREAAKNAGRGEPKPNQPVKAATKIGRNDPCPCGSGKKYKNCHGRNQ